MLALKLLVLWVSIAALVITIFGHGLVTYYRYEDDRGWGYSLKTWEGQSLERKQHPEYTYRYQTSAYENNAEARTIWIILILTAGSFVTLSLLSGPKDSAKGVSPRLSNAYEPEQTTQTDFSG